MKFDVFYYTCGNCGTVFEAPDLVGGYGLMLARSLGRGSMALVDAINDEVFAEVEGLVAAVANRTRMTDRQFGDVVRYAFSASCDVDSDGSPYRIGEHPRCPSCGSHRMRTWERSGKLIELDVPSVRHDNWSRTDAGQRQRLIQNAVNDFQSQG
jgi:hypothetical protein